CGPFIYTTALPESSIFQVSRSYALLQGMEEERRQLTHFIDRFQSADLPFETLRSTTPIQVVIVPGNDKVKELAAHLQQNGLDVRPILHPTVPEGSERLRIVLHSFNTDVELSQLIQKITYF
ncbi:MAG: 8-amino-7-oxononanoate synthase, partial [Chitinophagaceae bacterium]|nr:8-amino-7-oxononanoate synthase [Chitinophagaceae bacterium]